MSGKLGGAAELAAKSAGEWVGRNGIKAVSELELLKTAAIETVERATEQGKAVLDAVERKADELLRQGPSAKKGIPATAPELLDPYAADVGARLALARNPGTAPEVLARLADDIERLVRLWVAKNRNTPPEVLAKLAGELDREMRWVVAENPNTPKETLAILAADPDKYVRTAAAYNPNRRRDVPVREDWLTSK